MSADTLPELRAAEAFNLTAWRESASPADTLVSLVAVLRSPRVCGRIDADTISACREIVRLDPRSARGELLAALVDADTVDLGTVRRVLTRHGWPDTVNIADAVTLAWRHVIDERRRFLDEELRCAHTVATRRGILLELLTLEREAA